MRNVTPVMHVIFYMHHPTPPPIGAHLYFLQEGKITCITCITGGGGAPRVTTAHPRPPGPARRPTRVGVDQTWARRARPLSTRSA